MMRAFGETLRDVEAEGLMIDVFLEFTGFVVTFVETNTLLIGHDLSPSEYWAYFAAGLAARGVAPARR
jgi:hypothetical protein